MPRDGAEPVTPKVKGEPGWAELRESWSIPAATLQKFPGLFPVTARALPHHAVPSCIPLKPAARPGSDSSSAPDSHGPDTLGSQVPCPSTPPWHKSNRCGLGRP